MRDYDQFDGDPRDVYHPAEGEDITQARWNAQVNHKGHFLWGCKVRMILDEGEQDMGYLPSMPYAGPYPPVEQF